MHDLPRPTPIVDLDWSTVPSPCFVVDLRLLEGNGRILDGVRREAGCKILLALKGFALWAAFPVLRPYLDGCCASGAHEARLAREEFGGEVHTYAPAFSTEDLREVLRHADHLVFNSPGELARHAAMVQASPRPVSVGLRINPGHAEVAIELYNPCRPGSRLGTPRSTLGTDPPAGIEGLHFHALCEQNADVLGRVLARVEADFGSWFNRLRWLNCGGGHWITKPDYDRQHLISLLRGLHQRYPHLALYLEPGEAAAVDTGVLVASVLDVQSTGPVRNVILDVSPSCHMPDVLEMPYRPTILGAGAPGLTPYTYRLGGPTCLAGDVLGEWSFPAPLAIGDRVVFADMSHYTMVKTTQFNGVRHPAIALWDGQRLQVVRRFGYDDYRRRLS